MIGMRVIKYQACQENLHIGPKERGEVEEGTEAPVSME